MVSMPRTLFNGVVGFASMHAAAFEGRLDGSVYTSRTPVHAVDLVNEASRHRHAVIGKAAAGETSEVQ
jgi:hypothetical protein